MKAVHLIDLVKEVKGIPFNIKDTDMIYNVSTDSRKVSKGDLFIAICGEKFDGHDYVSQAVERGCSALLVHKDIGNSYNIPIIKVKNTLTALHDMARFYISQFQIPIIAVTGSTGKTTTKEMISLVLSQKYQVIKNIGNFNNHIGLPLSVFNIEEEHDVAIFEMGMSALGEIDLLASIVKPDIAVITNIGLSHIENLGTQENILKAKMEVVHYFLKENVLILNNDDEWLKTVRKEALDYKVVSIGIGNNSDIIISNISNQGEKGVNFKLNVKDDIYEVKLNVLGEHNIYNAALAIAVGIELNVDAPLTIKGIAEFQGYDMRLNIQTTKNNIKVLNDVYNASPDSMKAAIDTLLSVQGQRHITILSDMLEMGAHSKKYHEEVGKYAAKSGVDMIISVGEHAKYIAQGAQMGNNHSVLYFETNKELIACLGSVVQSGDVILVKGSRGMKMEAIVHYILER